MAEPVFLKLQKMLFHAFCIIIYLACSMGCSIVLAKQQVKKERVLEDGLLTPYPAPAFTGMTDWFNSAPLSLANLKGKVVLINFWTYSCTNCLRTLPYLFDWYKKYHAKGLVIIGIHAPEFNFEKNPNNVKQALLKQGIPYPVALDNTFSTWKKYENNYWPALYLVDPTGYVVYQHFGEGHYVTTENNIRYLLGINSAIISQGAPVAFKWRPAMKRKKELVVNQDAVNSDIQML